LNFLYTQYTIVAVSIFCDVAIFLLPIPLFLRLTLNRGVALGISFLFACGLLTTVCSIVRATYLKEVGPGGKGDNSMVVLFCAIETNVGVRELVSHSFNRLRTLTVRLDHYELSTILATVVHWDSRPSRTSFPWAAKQLAPISTKWWPGAVWIFWCRENSS
jgi:hypothetical protein